MSEPFDFVTHVQTHDPRCDVTYARSFTHADWVDGEDRVQAATTPEELGFNARFHGIENEFDAIAEQFRRLGACAAELRAESVGGLAGMTSTDLAGRVAGSGVQVSTEALRLAVARARVATAIRGRSR